MKLPWILKDLIVGKKNLRATQIEDQHDLVTLNEDDEQLYIDFGGVLSVDVDDESGVRTIGADMEESLTSAQMANRAVALLQDYIIRYITSQVNENSGGNDGKFWKVRRA